MRAWAIRGLTGLTDTMRGEGLRARMVRGALGSAGVQATSRALALVLGIILARTLGPEGYGIYAYAFAIMSLLMVVAEAGVPTLLMREVAAAEGRGEWGLLRGALRRGVQLVGVASVIIAVLGFVVLALFADSMAPASFQTMAVMLLVLPAAALSKTVAHGLMGLHKVVMAQAQEMLLRPLLVIGLVGAAFFLSPGLRTPSIAMAAQLAAVVTVLVIATFLLKRSMPAGARASAAEFRSRQWLKSALPFTLIGGALVINNQTDVVMLGWFTTADEVGVYRVAVQVSMLVFFPLNVIQAVLAPRFARLYADNERIALRSIDTRSRYMVTLLTAPIFITIAIFSEQIVVPIFGADFHDSVIPIVILSVGFFANVTCGASGTMMQMIQKEKIVLMVLLVTSALNIAGNVLLIPAFGIVGASISTAFTTFAYQLILRYYINRLI